ncbi:MAG: DUF4382 domain-containing protein [Gemmatimonadota bacterium]|jgi:hypothetical protein|nr:DUF4382 domain-containing protein [Gemmatimonadota bacterium]MDQ8156900.1 DUF4382 domain-containing protein [Gemmatimonadota bacterium]MDQ8177400.1 DUF4382 domain-containing protein [Gemmatimonadota bacterium]
MPVLSVRFLAALGAVIALVSVAACDDDGDTPLAPQRGALTLLLTDAPGDIRKAVVTIEKIYLQPDSNYDATADRVILMDDPITVDLLTLADTTQAIVDSLSIPAANYAQLRFVISGAYIAVEGADTASRLIYATSTTYAGLPSGTTPDGQLITPSWGSSGLKVQLPGNALTIVDDSTTTLLIDFDVSQSFGKAAGQSGNWIMSPIIQAMRPPTT